MPALLEVNNLHVAFGAAAPVVRGVSLALAAGEKLALVGESGSGKTLTALALLRLLHGARTTGPALWRAPGQPEPIGANAAVVLDDVVYGTIPKSRSRSAPS